MSRELVDVGIDQLATQMSLRDLGKLEGTDETGVSRAIAVAYAVHLRKFPVVADAGYAAAYLAGRESYDAYRVRRIFAMSIPECTLAGPHLVAIAREGIVND